MNWRMRTSFRLLGIAHKKKSAVTRKKGRRCPAGKSGRALDWAVVAVAPVFGSREERSIEFFSVRGPAAAEIEYRSRRERIFFGDQPRYHSGDFIQFEKASAGNFGQ